MSSSSTIRAIAQVAALATFYAAGRYPQFAQLLRAGEGSFGRVAPGSFDPFNNPRLAAASGPGMPGHPFLAGPQHAGAANPVDSAYLPDNDRAADAAEHQLALLNANTHTHSAVATPTSITPRPQGAS